MNGADKVHKAKSKKYKSHIQSWATVAVAGSAAGSVLTEGPADGAGAVSDSVVADAAAAAGAGGAVPVEAPSAVLSASSRGFLGGLPRLPLGRFFLASIAASSSGVRTWSH